MGMGSGQRPANSGAAQPGDDQIMSPERQRMMRGVNQTPMGQGGMLNQQAEAMRQSDAIRQAGGALGGQGMGGGFRTMDYRPEDAARDQASAQALAQKQEMQAQMPRQSPFGGGPPQGAPPPQAQAPNPMAPRGMPNPRGQARGLDMARGAMRQRPQRSNIFSVPQE